MARPILSYLLGLAALASPWTCELAVAQPSRPRTVLAIHWGSATFPTTPVVNAAILDALRANVALPVDYFTEYLESDRVPEQGSRALRDHIRSKYRGRRIDVVIAMADPALRFVLQHRAELFRGAPIVYSGVALPEDATRTAAGGLTAVMRGVAYKATLKLALDLHPSTDRVLVVANSLDARTTAAVRAELQEFEGRVGLSYVNAPTVSGLLDEVRRVPPRGLILYIFHQQNQSGSMMNSNDVARLIAAASKVPVYGTNETYIALGVVGGVVRRTAETAARVGEMTSRILSGARAQDIPIENARLVPIVDWRQVMRWRIDPSHLPADAELRFRVPTVWETYRVYVIVTVIVIIAQLLLIAALLVLRTQRGGAENALVQRESTLRRSYERIRLLAGRLINAQEAARANIARDLHDDLCQDLVGVSMAVGFLQRSSANLQDPQTQDALATLHRQTLDMVEGVRNLSHELHPATLRLVGLAAALGGHCVEVEKRHDVQVSFRVEGDVGDVHDDVALCLFRIAQEALRNGVAHGHARRLAVSIAKLGDMVELKVGDDGRGFNLDAVRRDGTGLGLVSIEERAHVLGGDVQIVTQPLYGTRIRVRIPLSATADAGREDINVRVRVFTPQLSSKPTEQS